MTDNYFESEEFLTLLRDYEERTQNGESPLLGSDDFTSIAEYYHSKGRREEAFEILERALDCYPDASAPLIFKSRLALIEEEDVEKAQELLDRVEDRSELEYYYMQAELYIAQHLDDEAADLLDELWEKSDEDTRQDIALDVANLYIDYDMPEEAETWLRRFDDQTLEDYLELLGRIEVGKGNYKEGMDIFNRLIDKNPYSSYYWNLLASTQMMRGDIYESIESSEYALAINNDDPDAVMNKANCLYKLGNYEDAMEYYQRYIRINPTDCRAYLCQGICMLGENRFQEAAVLLDKAEELASGNGQSLLDIYQEQAFVNSRLGNLDKALSYLDKAKSLPCDKNDLLVLRGHILLEHGCIEEAQQAFEQAVTGSGNSYEIYFRIAVSVYDNGYTRLACKMFLQMQRVSDRHDGLAYIAACCYDMGERELYLKYLQLACELVPEETKMVLEENFPEELRPEDYYKYELQKINQ
ncbi:MAG: tetratricopeptide repeat protein [Prevotella sp.]|nr:tetratricopeptide repeat protein [Prevotella sp.]